MKSLTLWNACKPYSDHVWSLFRYVKIFFRRGIVSISFLFLFGCSEKNPILPLNNNLVSFDSVTVTAGLISDTTIFAEPYIGSNSYLVVGEDDNLRAYSLLLFKDLSTPLDTILIERILSCDLILRTGGYLVADTTTPALTMSVASLEGDGLEAWTEDSTNSTNFILDNYTQTEWHTFTFSETDTLIFNLPTAFITNWRDTSKSHYGLVIKPVVGSDAGLGIIYSGETISYPYIVIDYLDDKGDTSSMTLTIVEDVTVTEYKKNLSASPQPLLIGAGKAAYTFMKFRVEEVITDKNLFIAGANLYLYVNPDLTETYAKSYTIYVSLLDSTEWDDLTFSPSSYAATRTFSGSDSLFTLKIPYTVQLFTSGYNGNFGIALWISPSSIYPGLLGFSPTEDSDPARRPYMEILTMQEE